MAAAMGFSLCCLSIAGAASSAIQTSDEFIAERALGPQWQKVSRHSGMIFTATVLASTTPPTAKQIPKLQPTPIDHLAPAQIEIRFHVDEAIAGVKRGQIVIVHEWSGASSRHRPFAPGQRLLLFLYPLGRLGFTSPVGGSRGLVPLDTTGKTVFAQTESAQVAFPTQSPRPGQSAGANRVSVLQLERAIRRARRD